MLIDNHIDVSLIIVHYNTPRLLASLLESISVLHDLSTFNYEIVIINNGSSLANLGDSLPLMPKVFEQSENLGYAGAINLGIQLAKGDILFLMNSDLSLTQGSISTLIGELSKYSVVGPRFYLDTHLVWQLPPIERFDFVYLLAKEHRSSLRWMQRWQKMYWDHCLRHLTATESIRSFGLSGALLAMTRQTWEWVGSFDTEFQLYYEEVDWLKRAENLGASAAYVPGSRVIHHYNQAAQLHAKSSTWFNQSEKYFYDKHFGSVQSLLVTRMELITGEDQDLTPQYHWKQNRSVVPETFTPIPVISRLNAGGSYYLQMSPFPYFIPAAVRYWHADETNIFVDDETWSKMQPGSYYFRIVDENGMQKLP